MLEARPNNTPGSTSLRIWVRGGKKTVDKYHLSISVQVYFDKSVPDIVEQEKRQFLVIIEKNHYTAVL